MTGWFYFLEMPDSRENFLKKIERFKTVLPATIIPFLYSNISITQWSHFYGPTPPPIKLASTTAVSTHLLNQQQITIRSNWKLEI